MRKEKKGSNNGDFQAPACLDPSLKKAPKNNVEHGIW